MHLIKQPLVRKNSLSPHFLFVSVGYFKLQHSDLFGLALVSSWSTNTTCQLLEALSWCRFPEKAVPACVCFSTGLQVMHSYEPSLTTS